MIHSTRCHLEHGKVGHSRDGGSSKGHALERGSIGLGRAGGAGSAGGGAGAAGTTARGTGRGRGTSAGGGLVTGAGLARLGGLEGGGAGEVEHGLGGQVLGDGELHGVVGVGVAESVPESGDLVEQLAAANLIPEVLGVLDAGNSQIPRLADVGPAGLGHPELLVADGGLDSVKGAVEELARVGDDVVLAVLVVGVLVNTDEVDSIDDRLVGSVDPCVPRVDMADGDVGEGCVGEPLLEVVDEAHEQLGTRADASLVLDAGGRVAVQVLGADRDANDEVRELRAVLLDAVLEGEELGVDVLHARGPDAEKDRGVGLDGGVEGLDGLRGLGVGLDVGIETDGVELAGGVLEVLGRGELLHPVLLELGGAVGKRGSRVEAEVIGRGGRHACCEDGGGGGKAGGGSTHYVWAGSCKSVVMVSVVVSRRFGFYGKFRENR